MSHKKNIERLFQEKFKDFEVEPPARVWGNIESQLKSKNERKIIPLWWKLSGIAAALILGSIISYSILNTDNQNGNSKDQNNIQVVEGNSNKSNSNPSNNTRIQKESGTVNSNNVINSDAIVNATNQKTNSSDDSNSTKPTLKLKNPFNKNSVANHYNKTTTKHNNKRKNQVSTNSETITENNNVLENNINPIVDNSLEVKNQIIAPTNESVKKDSIPSQVVASTTPNPLEELLKEKEAKSTTKNDPKSKLKRWQVSSNASPVYYNSVAQGSPLDIEFQDNNKEYKTNLGYGIGVKYALNKRFSIKTGANAVAMEYNTNDVVFSQESFSNSINNLSANLEGSYLQIQSRSVSFANSETKFDGKLNQKMGYFEVPVELSYKVIDRKFGIEIIGGFSTLFLNENKVSLISSGLDLNIGEASNLRQIHYSTNIGLGFKYSFWKSFQANFEPMFKYQINTFSNDTGNFKPYILGLYTGVSYSF